jgi:hypothetical protein
MRSRRGGRGAMVEASPRCVPDEERGGGRGAINGGGRWATSRRDRRGRTHVGAD